MRTGLSGKFRLAMIAIAAGIAASCAPAFAQTPAAPRATLPPALISRAEVRVIIDTAIAFAQQRKMLMAVVVTDHTGQMISADRIDGGSYRNIIFAEGKAFASAVFQQTTEDLGALVKTRPDRYFGIQNMYPGKVYLVGGGVPLVLDGVLVGAVGIAGLPQGVDEEAGRAGIAAWMKFRETMKK